MIMIVSMIDILTLIVKEQARRLPLLLLHLLLIVAIVYIIIAHLMHLQIITLDIEVVISVISIHDFERLLAL